MDLKVTTYHFEDRFHLEKAKTIFKESPIKSDSTFLLFELGDTAYVYVKDFGSVVFINIPKAIVSSVMSDLSKENKSVEMQENTIVIDAQSELQVEFDTITIPSSDAELMHIIALNLAQSSALHRYQSITDDLLEETRQFSIHLEQTGKVKLSRKQVAKYIGRTMNLRNRIAENLYIFEAPPLAWTDVRLSELDTKLSEELDFENRYRGIQMSLNVIRENHDFYTEILQHKHSSMLEWIIILLILFEVAHIFIK